MLQLSNVDQQLSCDLETGILTWIYNYQRPDLIGQRAGYINNGYWRLSINGTEYYTCQIVWLFVKGEWPTSTIDHIDGNGENDVPSNLRLATKGQNAANSGMNCRNTTGYKGVSVCSTTGRYRASITTNGKSRNLGRFDTPEEAHQAWLEAAQEAYGVEFVRAA